MTENTVVNLIEMSKSTTNLVDLANKAQQAMHKGQVRKFSGEPYHTHPQEVVRLVRQYTDDETVICAAYLHDVLEDCEGRYHYSEMIDVFGLDCVVLVGQLTNKYTQERFKNIQKWQRKAMETHRLVHSTDLRAKVIKLCDIAANAKPTGDQSLPDSWYRTKWEFIYRVNRSLDTSADYKKVVQDADKLVPEIVDQDISNYKAIFK